MDLQTVFSAVCNMTITASVVIGCVLLARFALQKAPKGFACALWLVVLFRFLCPVAPAAPVSVLNVVDAPRATAGVSAVTYVQSPVQAPLETIHADPSLGMEATPSIQPAEPVVDWHLLASHVWAAGVTLLAAYGILSYVNLKCKLRESVPAGPGLREADFIRSPFLLGFLRPVIYLPSGLSSPERRHILLHERCHLRHGDHLVKAAFWLAVCLHWFNPLAWLAFVLSGRNMEMRCDEAVLRSLGPQVRSDYAQALLNFSAGRSMAPAPLAFGEGDTGKRVRHVLGWKQKAAWALIPAAILCAVVLLITAVNPGGEQDSPFGHSYRAVSSYASVYDYPFPINTYYTLSSDMGLFIQGEQTEQVGFFREVQANADNLKAFSDGFWRMIRRSWNIEGTGWWLIEHKSGDLQLHNLDRQVTHTLARTDLLGVTIEQPGVESYVEPAWYSSDTASWSIEALASTLVSGDATISLMPETDVDMILVSEEYYELLKNGEYTITVSDHFLERDAKGRFALNVFRRGSVGDDFAIYRVTVGEDNFVFRLAFPAVPGETFAEVHVPEETRAVTFTHDNAFITLHIPESWSYATLSPEDEEYDASMTGGISFWPAGREEGKIFFGYYPDLFAVCGTGLKTGTMLLAGQNASVGTYDDREVWDFIRFSDHFAVWGQGHEAWWAEYGEQAMAILDSAVFSEAGIDLSDFPEGENICELPASPTEP